MMRLRSGLIGSMRAWLPSRRSTAHHLGAAVIRASGHVRSGRCTAICSEYGRYLWTGMPEVFWVFFMMSLVSRQMRGADTKLRDEEGPRSRTRRGG